MNNSEFKLSIIIPAYNEELNLQKGALAQVERYVSDLKYPYEIIIVDDASTDDSVDMIKSFINGKSRYHLIENTHGGKAITVMTGLLAAKGAIVLFTDMDQATPLMEVEKLLPEFNRSYDIVIGSRSGRVGAPLVRKLSAWGFATLRGLILGLPYKDTQCGFKAFSQKAIHEIFPDMLKRWKENSHKGAAVNAGFDVETLYIAKKKGLKVAEVPVEWHHVGSERVQIVKDAIEAIKDLLRIRLNSWMGNYK